MASKIIERGVRGIPRNVITLEDLSATSTDEALASAYSRYFRYIPQKIYISLHYESDANVKEMRIDISYRNKDRTYYASHSIYTFTPGTSGCMIIEFEPREGAYYLGLVLRVWSKPGVTGTGSLKNILIWGSGIAMKKPWWERNVSEYRAGISITVPAGTPVTEAWSYFVPSGRCARIIAYRAATEIDDPALEANLSIRHTGDDEVALLGRDYFAYNKSELTTPILIAGQGVRARYRNGTTADYDVRLLILILEFDSD